MANVEISEMARAQLDREQVAALEAILPSIQGMIDLPEFRQYVGTGKLALIDSKFETVDRLFRAGVLVVS